MADVKGALLNAWIRFLKKRYGEPAFGTAAEALTPDERLALQNGFLPASWYPYDTMHVLRRLTRGLVDATDGNLSAVIGRAVAEDIFTGVYRPLLAKDPRTQVSQFRVTAEFCYRQAIRVEARLVGDDGCDARYVYEPGARPSRAICESIAGFWAHTLELAGATQVEYEHPNCMAAGQSACEFSFRWKA